MSDNTALGNELKTTHSDIEQMSFEDAQPDLTPNLGRAVAVLLVILVIYTIIQLILTIFGITI
jgi:hypothetical protein